MKRVKVRKYAGCALAGLTFLLAGGLCWATLAIWLEGRALRATDPAAVIFTPAAVSARLRWVLPVLVMWLAALLTALCAGGGRRTPGRARAANRNPNEKPTSERKIGLLWFGLLALSAALIVLGVWNGGLRDVLIKAANICTECIGLG